MLRDQILGGVVVAALTGAGFYFGQSSPRAQDFSLKRLPELTNALLV